MTKSSEYDNFDYVIILPKEIKDLKYSFGLELPFGNTIGIQSASSSTRLGVYYYESTEDFQNALMMTIDQSKIESVENRAIDYVPDGDFEIVVQNGTAILIYEEDNN